MDVTVLVPYRYKDEWRDRIYAWTSTGWLTAGVPLVVGHDDYGGPFNFSRAINRAVRRCSTDGVVVYGADSIPDPSRVEQLGDELEHHAWIGVYDSTAVLSRGCADLLLEGEDTVLSAEAVVPFCTGILAMRREVLLDVPMDERFAGWGCEDVAHRLALEAIYGPPGPARGTAYVMPHEHSGWEGFAANEALVREYEAARHDAAAMREVVARGAPAPGG